MFLGTVVGQVVATRKHASLKGHRLLVVQPIDHARIPTASPIIAVDTVSVGTGETVYWVSAREAPNALPGADTPIDAAIVGIVDTINV
jgi:ethanolamine utilization protein EutN